MRQRRKRRFFTAAESAEIWDRWRKGEGLKSIGRVFGELVLDLRAHLPDRRHSAAAPAAFQACTDARRT
jgi:hypothetical protein